MRTWTTCCRTAAIGLLFLAGTAHAVVITSVSRAAFQDAIAGGAIASEDFDGLVAGTILGVTPDVTYSASGGDVIVTDAFLTTTFPNGIGSTSFGFYGPDETATFSFSTAITAFAIDVNTFAVGDGSYEITLNTGDTVTSLFEVFPGQITGQFFGFVTDEAFDEVTVRATTGFTYTLDTLVYGDAAAVVIPIPAAWLLFGGALGCLGLMRRGRRI